jgi:hypothetical protein
MMTYAGFYDERQRSGAKTFTSPTTITAWTLMNIRTAETAARELDCLEPANQQKQVDELRLKLAQCKSELRTSQLDCKSLGQKLEATNVELARIAPLTAQRDDYKAKLATATSELEEATHTGHSLKTERLTNHLLTLKINTLQEQLEESQLEVTRLLRRIPEKYSL